eukprot:CAMPEP_0115280888 /NCGR_PEP_ID=MMETSP0270-20121206/59028_1 /TAXON_ID=71861 /ORGANISM="Scrippsiella trochoidea, Strain CCMP3099" /LENGTH=91 /DNA_ID=CAMNT_0002697655 /DNA_START=182 /DNA_END=455 /DNA_ORIENTATION=-
MFCIFFDVLILAPLVLTYGGPLCGIPHRPASADEGCATATTAAADSACTACAAATVGSAACGLHVGSEAAHKGPPQALVQRGNASSADVRT